MTKNTTRKGLALGAASALVLAGFSALPANAAGLADTSFVRLAPTTGTEYNVLAVTGSTFSLTSNEATTVSTGDMKFLVTDASGVVETTIATTGRQVAVADDDVVTVTDSATATVTIANTTNPLAEGDRFFFDKDLNLDTFVDDESSPGAIADFVVAAQDTVFTVSAVVADTSFSFVAGDASAVLTDKAGAVDVSGGLAITVIREDRHATNNTYVVDSGSTSDADNEVLVLAKDASVTARSVTVQAWMDANDNDLIDSTEYTSPVRTVSWLAAADVTAVTTVNYPTGGAANVTGSVVLTPNLNGDQQNASTDVQVGFTRPGSTATVYVDATQDATTREWTATQSLATGNWVGMPHIGQLESSDDDNSTSATYTLEATIGIAAGDTVIIDSSGVSGLDRSSATAVTGGTAPAFTIATAGSDLADVASGDTGYVRVVAKDIASAVFTATKVTITTTGAHNLSIGDTVSTGTLITTATSAQGTIANKAVAAVTSATAFEIAGTFVAETADATTGTLAYVSYTQAVAGNYTAKTKVNAIARGNTSSSVTVASTSDDTTLASTATVNVQGVSIDTNATTTIVNVRKGETSVELTATVVDVNDVAVTANRPVVVTLGAPETSPGNKVGTFTVNGTAYSSAVTLLTDAAGKVTFTIGENDGAVGSAVEVNVVPEGLATTQTAELDLIWADAVYGIFDLNDNSALATTGNNSIVAGGSYSYSLAVLDQWKSAPADGTYRAKYATTNRTVGTDYVTLTNGRGSYTVTDRAITGETTIQTVFSLEELQTDGTWADGETLLQTGTTLTYTTSVVAATNVDAVLLDTDGSTAYGSGTADLSATAATVATAAQDRRITNSVQPVYGATQTADVTGRVSNSVTNATRAGALVTISGPSNILFSDGAVDAFGSLTLRADAAGEFAVELFSNTAQVDTVITVTSGAGSKTVEVTFIGSGASFGTAIAIDAPASVMPGTSFKVTATVTDKNGNAVVTGDNDQIRVTYTGPGIIIATMPDDTDSKGQVSFTVLLGTNDSGTGVVAVSYDRGDDGDFTGTTAADMDVTATASITVGAVASSDTKVTVGTYKGYVAVFTKGYEGQKLSVRVASKWHVRNPIVDLKAGYSLLTVNTGAGYVANVIVYIDGVEVERMTITTR